VDEHGEMKGEVFNLAAYAIEKFSTEMDISKHIKAHFDEKRRSRAGAVATPRDDDSSSRGVRRASSDF